LSSSWTNSSRLSSAVAAREMRAIVASVCSSYVTSPKYPKYAVSAAAMAKPPTNMAAEPGTLLDRDHGSLLAGLWPKRRPTMSARPSPAHMTLVIAMEVRLCLQRRRVTRVRTMQ